LSPARRPRKAPAKGPDLTGRRFTVETGNVGHGGFVVARHEGVVVFVRHALPGERVVAEVTEGRAGDRFLRADAVEVLVASPDRVTPPCPFAGPGRCGGCDFQHAALPAQRGLKAAVVAEQLRRLAGLDVPVTVEEVPGAVDGLGWRTRVQWAVAGGTVGLRKHRSHAVVPVDRCRIAHPAIADAPPAPDGVEGVAGVETIVASDGETLTLLTTRDGRTFADGPTVLQERAAGRGFEVTGSGFWQVHPGAAETLVTAVLGGLDPRPGERAADLYSGVGLFSAALAERVGTGGHVVAVESDEGAVDDAQQNLSDLHQVAVLADRVDRALAADLVGPRDLVVLDPPRTGARREVVEGIIALRPRAVAYVACDPAALARDVAIFAEHGYALESLRAFDLFPMTHHVECVAILSRAQQPQRGSGTRPSSSADR
jgi:tRNA/tmRNA/rRNA uracil-C5-methylase (TrmA/RlmC/RlmD family)